MLEKRIDSAPWCPSVARTCENASVLQYQCHLDREPISSCLFEEGLKLLMSLGLVILEHGGLRGTFKALLAIEFGDSIRLAVPALLFVFQNAARLPAWLFRSLPPK